MKRIILSIVFGAILFLSNNAFARENVQDWYVQNFESKIVVNKDSSINITEDITADCGNAVGKHGIFRVIPTERQISATKTEKNPIDSVSVTDFNENPVKFSTIKNIADKTLTLKIGDPNVIVTGVNNYRIKYHVQNAVLHNNSNFDEFYWNLSGNFWDIPIDRFKADIQFPQDITQQNTEVNIYSGAFLDKNKFNVQGKFVSENEFQIEYSKTLNPKEGITLSVTFPKNIVSPYVPSFFEKYGYLFGFLIPIAILYLCVRLWKKYGKDPSINPTVAPEFEIPESLSPMEMGMVYTDGLPKNQFLSASIVNLAVKGYLVIEKIAKKGILSSEDFKLIKKSSKEKISKSEEKLLEDLFLTGNEIQLSNLKNNFYLYIPRINEVSKKYLIQNKWLLGYSRTLQIIFFVVSFVLLLVAISFFAISISLALNILIASIIVFIFSFIIRNRTKEGAILNRRIKGFRLYMEKAEKYRQKFNEKENIFEKFLPYAIMFSMTKQWANKMKEIYGEKYFQTYHPIWFIGPAFSTFNVDSFASEISSMSSSMASTIASNPSSSGSGGGGFSGGGGGGGGGGGW